MEVNGLPMSDELIELLKEYRTDDDLLSWQFNAIDQAISFIALESGGCSLEESKKALIMIAGLCGIKDELNKLKGALK